MTTLTVVTHTRGDRPEFLRQCCASVEASLPPKAQHLVIKLSPIHDIPSLLKARLAALALGDIVAFVDDDDYLIGDTLSQAYDAIMQHDAGLCFTGERMVDLLGNKLQDSDVTGPKFASMIACHPNIAHHLCLIRTSCVAKECWTKDYGPGLEWMIKGSAALSSKSAVFVPTIGYCWRQHANSASKSDQWTAAYDHNTFSTVSNDLDSMITKGKDIRIPVFPLE